MKFTWEEKDIVGGRDVLNSAGEHCVVAWKPGSDKHGDERWMIVSLVDGMVVRPFSTKASLAQGLTEHAYIPAKL